MPLGAYSLLLMLRSPTMPDFLKAFEHCAKAVRSVVGGLVDCDVRGAEWLTEQEAEEEVAEGYRKLAADPEYQEMLLRRRDRLDRLRQVRLEAEEADPWWSVEAVKARARVESPLSATFNDEPKKSYSYSGPLYPPQSPGAVSATAVPGPEAPEEASPDPASSGVLEKNPLPWSVEDGTNDWWLKGAFPGLVLDAWGVVIGRFDTMAQAELVVAAVNATKDPSPTTVQSASVPSVSDEGPAVESDIPPSTPAGRPTSHEAQK
jgi:hypothetical protein